MRFRTVAEVSRGEYTSERSRFISYLYPVVDGGEAERLIAEHSRRFRDARHNVFAYRLPGGAERAGDAGEPRSTAGAPTLDVLRGEGLAGCLIVTSRYFGGVLLGTGGLVRAYSAAARAAVGNARIVEMESRRVYGAAFSYPAYAGLAPLLAKCGARVLGAEYGAEVRCEIAVPGEDFPAALNEICLSPPEYRGTRFMPLE